MPLEIPLIRPTLSDRDACFADFERIWTSGRLASGPFTERFEAAISRRLGVLAAVCVGSCTSGLMLLQRALGLQGEVIIPTFTWTATGTSLLWNGLTPVFVDSRPGDFSIDPDRIAEAITPRTAAICPVAAFGAPTQVDEIAELAARNRLIVYYDSAQAFGATYRDRPLGGFGSAEVFSMSPTKALTAVDMGVVTTNDASLAAQVRQMRDYGKSADSDDVIYLGLSVRPSEFHAVVGYHNLQHVDQAIFHRGRMIARYRRRLTGVPGLSFQEVPLDRASSNNYMMIFVGPKSSITRDDLYGCLREEGIESKRYFHPCLHEQTVFRGANARAHAPLPVAGKASREGLALPLYGHMSEGDVDRVSEVVAASCR